MARNRKPQEKLETNMSAMIDVVFQLLIFFMLTLKLIEPEGDFNINMPARGKPTEPSPDPPPLDTKVKLRANPDGTLVGVYLGSRPLGNDSDAFKRLNIEILRLIGSPDNPLAEDMAVEIDADYNLHFKNVISAVGACTGRVDPRTQRVVKYIKNIKFKPPQKPGAAS
ncbi:biopolymer transporter ExbD [bacterium]|nr:biopolymer transporter ExbD [bacterium]